MIGLDETKKYLRVDFDDEDELITSLIASSKTLCLGVLRSENESDLDSDDGKMAMLYAVAYFYEHREEANHHELVMNLRNLLFSNRNEGF